MTPRPQEHLFDKQYALELLKIAEGDLLSAQALNESPKGRRENICFLAQQAIEKSLKAVLVWLQIPFPLVHDAGVLVAKMPAPLTPPLGYDLSVLTSYATVRRYEESRSALKPESIKAVLEAGQSVLDWAKSQCK
jgi:HEPN domain-containing protein